MTVEIITDTALIIRCEDCGRRIDSGRYCVQCNVPDINDPTWAGYGGATEDFLVAAPNVKRVR
jgi:hypothetical protein